MGPEVGGSLQVEEVETQKVALSKVEQGNMVSRQKDEQVAQGHRREGHCTSAGREESSLSGRAL